MVVRGKEAMIKYSINWAIQLSNINQIIIIIDLLHTTKKIFNLLIYPY